MKGKYTVSLMHVSEFDNVRSKKSRTITMEDFIKKVKEGAYREPVERLRRLRATPGKEGEAHAVKENFECIMPVGTGDGHAVKCLRTLSGVLCIDLDHTGPRTREVKRLLQQLPWVCGCFVSPSGEGVKVMVRVEPEEVEAHYPRLYAAVGQAISRHVDHPYDEKCSILTQPCFYSFDPDAFFRPDAEVFRLPATAQSASAEDAPQTAPPQAADTPQAATTPHSAPGFVQHFLRRFERDNPFVRGQRNDIALKLGRVAAYNGFTPAEVEQLLQIFIQHYSNADFTAADIRKRVMAGYQHVSENGQTENLTNYLHFTSTSTMEAVSVECVTNLLPSMEEEETEEIQQHNNRMRSEAPYLPEEVYAELPLFLQRCVAHTTNRRDRDVLLLCAICCCSALFPHVRFLYRQATCSPHFYLAIVAPAGTGKGMLGHAAALLDATQDHYNELRRQMKRDYEEKQAAWSREQLAAAREKRKPDLSMRPEEMRLPYFKISPNTSKSRFMESLAGAGEVGCCMFSTEMLTLSSAMGQECGHFDDILLKAFHHEEVSSSYKIDGEPIVVRHPYLSLCLSGTQEQFASLFHSHETGLFSRFALYTRQQELEWESCAPGEVEKDLRHHFRLLGEELFVMHRELLQSPTKITFTRGQWAQHTGYYTAAIRQAQVEGKDTTGSIVFRNALIAMRIAATLTMFRKWDDYRYASAYTCTDTDFRTAMAIARTLLEHSLLLGTSLPESLRKPMLMRDPHRMERVLASLPEEFTFTMFNNTAIEEGVSKTSALRLLRRAVKMQLIVKEGDVYRKVAASAETASIAEVEVKWR